MGENLNSLVLRVLFFYFLPPFFCFILMYGYSKLLFSKMKLISDENSLTLAPKRQSRPSGKFVYIEGTDSELSNSMV